MVKDHLGKEYQSVNEMCNYYQIKIQTYYYRINHGYTLDQALTFDKAETRKVAKTKFVNCPTPVDAEERTDHKGIIHESKISMCEYYGLSKALYDYRRKLGWTVELALCTPVNRTQLPIEKRTINGIVYRNVYDICEKVFDSKISVGVLSQHLKNTRNTNEAIKKVNRIIRQKKIKELRKRILKKHGIDMDVYYSRINRNWSYADAMTTPKSDRNGKEMCDEKGMSYLAYLKRRQRGASVEVALGTPIKLEKSMMEKEIRRILWGLKGKNIIDDYKQNYTFDDCRDKAKLPFDFMVVRNGHFGVIEFDGQQHFRPTCFWSQDEAKKRGYRDTKEAALKEYDTIRRHDLQKNEYCEVNKIPLLRIKYTQTIHMGEMILQFLDDLNLYNDRINPYQTNDEYYTNKR